MGGLSLALALIVGHIEIHGSAARVAVLNHGVIAQVQGFGQLIPHELAFSLPLPHLQRKQSERFFGRHFFAKIDPVGEPQGAAQNDQRNQRLRQPGNSFAPQSVLAKSPLLPRPPRRDSPSSPPVSKRDNAVDLKKIPLSPPLAKGDLRTLPVSNAPVCQFPRFQFPRFQFPLCNPPSSNLPLLQRGAGGIFILAATGTSQSSPEPTSPPAKSRAKS